MYRAQQRRATASTDLESGAVMAGGGSGAPSTSDGRSTDVGSGPCCAGCGHPAPHAEAVLALNTWWHRHCLRCAEPTCRVTLTDEYHVWQDEPYCRHHFLKQAAEVCAACGEPVDGGLRALGRIWHDICICTIWHVWVDAQWHYYCHDKEGQWGCRVS